MYYTDDYCYYIDKIIILRCSKSNDLCKNQSTVMKKINQLFSIFLFSVFSFYSCSNDSIEKPKLVAKMVTTNANGTGTTTIFTYVGNEIKTTDNKNFHIDFQYEEGLIVRKIIFDKSNKSTETVDYTYNLGKLIRSESLDKFKIKYTHNENNTVTYQKFLLIRNRSEQKEYHGVLYLENDNFSKDERVYDNTVAGTITESEISYDYDAQNNPIYNIKGFKKLLDHYQVISANNSIISTEVNTTMKDDKVISSAKSYFNTIKYDSDNYPKEQISDRNFDGFGNLKTEYFY